MALKLFMRKSSPPCRAVLMTAEALGVSCEHVKVTKEDQTKTEFLKLGPIHTVPILVDNGKAISDSHAIITYLVRKYANNDSLYPKDPYKRALVDQRLYFDTDIAFSTSRTIRRYLIAQNTRKATPELIGAANKSYGILDKFLQESQWAAGEEVTLADFSLIPSITTCDTMVPIDYSKFQNMTAWIKKAQSWPYYGINEEGLVDFKKGLPE